MVFGIIIVFIGICLLLKVLIPGFNVDFNLIWPVALMVLGIYSFIKEKGSSLFGLIIFFVGGWFLFYNQGFINEEYYVLFWPIMIILFGLFIVFSSFTFKNRSEKIKTVKVTDKSASSYKGVFGGISEKITSKDFKSCDIEAIFGGVELDLRNVKITSDIVINVNAIFGGVDLIMPNDFNIKVNSNAFLGGVDNKASSEFEKDRFTIYVNATSVFGGVDLK